ncbi:MAG: right-handed parallel beta-helix repeat-containing protein [Flavobacteriaceae bacterium]
MDIKLHLARIPKCLLGLLAIFNLFSCETEDSMVSPKLIIANQTIAASNGSTQYTIDVLTNSTWEAQANVDWISLEETAGEKGRFHFLFSVSENDDDERNGVITIMLKGYDPKEIIVNQEAGNRDDIYVRPGGTGDGFGWDRATNLENAFNIAASGNTIHIAEGTYLPTKIVTGGDPGDTGDLTFEISKNIALIGGYPSNATKGVAPDPSKHPTILSGNDTSYHVVVVSALKEDDRKVTLKGLTISNGKASSISSNIEIRGVKFQRNYAGGLIVGDAVLDIHNTKITNNMSEKYAAGLYAFQSAVVTMEGSEVSHNSATSNVGGMWIRESKAYISNSKILENSGGTGAGVHAYPDAEIYMNNTVISGNQGRSFGAGFYARQFSKGVLVNCLINNNFTQTTTGGGGVMLYNNSNVTIINSTITNNTVSDGPGGGVFRRLGDNVLNVYNSIISGNHQINDGPDVDTYETGVAAPLIKYSISGAAVMDGNGDILSGETFNPITMLNQVEELVILPVGDNNPALNLGATSEELIGFGTGQDPQIIESIITTDYFYNSRTGLNIMGAFVKAQQ